MKKLCYVVLVLGSALLFSPSAQAISLDFAPSSQVVVVGNQVSVDLVISGLGNMTAPSLSTFDLNVLFNSPLLALDTTDANSDGVIDSVVLDPSGQLDLFGLGGNSVSAGLIGPGMLNVFELSLDSPADLDSSQAGSFILAKITFNSLSVGTSPLGLTINSLGDSNGNPLMMVSGSPGLITVTTIPEPSTVALLGTSFLGLFFLSSVSSIFKKTHLVGETTVTKKRQ